MTFPIWPPAAPLHEEHEREKRFSKGGHISGPPTRCQVLVREDGSVSFDGPRGPWTRILTLQQIRDYGAETLAALNGTKK